MKKEETPSSRGGGNGPDPRDGSRYIDAGGDRTVLVVEDRPELRSFLRQALKRYGFEVLEAGTAEEALILANSVQAPIDVLLMDIMLPDSWGTQLAEDIRTLHPDVGVILTSGRTLDDPVLGAGITQRAPFLKKPFRISELLEAISEVSEVPASLGPDDLTP
jgi:two-component system, cell cycle sensor histidine kinase and response regulator CckA